MYVRGIRSLFAFVGFVVARISMSRELVQVNLDRDKRFALRCPSCGGPMHCNRVTRQTARDLPLGSAVQVRLVYPAIQGRCRSCGGWATIHPPGIDPHARFRYHRSSANTLATREISGRARAMSDRRKVRTRFFAAWG